MPLIEENALKKPRYVGKNRRAGNGKAFHCMPDTTARIRLAPDARESMVPGWLAAVALVGLVIAGLLAK